MDNLTYTPGVGATVATDDLTSDGTVGGHVQLVKIVDATDNGNGRAPATAARGLSVDPRLKVVRIAATPTISTTPAYTAKDAVGGLLTFSNAARASGGSIRLESVQIADAGNKSADLDLVLFDGSITAPTDNSIFAPTTTEIIKCVGAIPVTFGHYFSFSTNTVAHVDGIGLEMKLSGTDLCGVLVARSTPTYTTTSDLTVTITVLQD